jgi:hypothetical protein
LCLTLFELIFLALGNTSFIEKYVVSAPKFTPKEVYEEILENRNPTTGWPSSVAARKLYHDDSSRKSPANRLHETSKESCLAIYGDSYTFDFDVDDNQAWPNVLARTRKCPVLNRGVGSFGLDQSFLRFKTLHLESAPAVLSFIDGDFARSLTRNYTFYRTGKFDLASSKPMFTLSNEKNQRLDRLPPPVLSHDNYLEIRREPLTVSAHLINDFYLPGRGIHSKLTWVFQYSLSIIKLTGTLSRRALTNLSFNSWHEHFQFADELGIRETLSQFADMPPSYTEYSLELNTAILREFLIHCEEIEIECKILKLPYLVDFDANWATPIDLYLKGEERIADRFLTLSRECLIAEFKIRGVQEDQINKQVGPTMHYNPVASEVIAACVNIEL